MGSRIERLPSMILALLFVIPALISCSTGRNPEESAVPESTAAATPQETVAPATLDPNDEVLAECIEGDVAFHFHVRLTISLEGSYIPVPPGVGLTPDCIHALHTHNSSGVIHIEHLHRDDFTLGDFFLVGQRWGGFDPLVGMQVVRVSVNGERYLGDYRVLPLTDELDIHLELVRLTSA
jgi:hypothetical protein